MSAFAVNDEVVEFTPDRHGSGGRIVPAVVVKIGKRDIVLDNGSRYNVARPTRRAGSAWDPSTRLLRADDREVAIARKRNHAQRLKTRVVALADAVAKAANSGQLSQASARAHELRAALDELIKEAT